MNSRITMEWDFDENVPYIKIKQSGSADLRDSIIKRFIEMIAYESNWCRIDFRVPFDSDHLAEIRPIGNHNIKKEAELMSKAFKIIQKGEKELEEKYG